MNYKFELSKVALNPNFSNKLVLCNNWILMSSRKLEKKKTSEKIFKKSSKRRNKKLRGKKLGNKTRMKAQDKYSCLEFLSYCCSNDQINSRKLEDQN